LDTNTWIALTVETHPHHAAARRWYDAAPLGSGDLLFCRPTEISFLRLVTQERVMQQQCGAAPLTNDQAITFLANLYDDPAVARVDDEPPATRSLWLELARSDLASPNTWMDAYLSALAISLGAEFVTFDRGFSVYQDRGLDLRLLPFS
jgi:hypothetical protein